MRKGAAHFAQHSVLQHSILQHGILQHVGKMQQQLVNHDLEPP